MLEIIGQLLCIIETKEINFQEVPEIICLAKDGEEMTKFVKLQPDEILLRWVNYHLAKVNFEFDIEDLDNCLTDPDILMFVMNSLDNEKCPIIEDEDIQKLK